MVSAVLAAWRDDAGSPTVSRMFAHRRQRTLEPTQHECREQLQINPDRPHENGKTIRPKQHVQHPDQNEDEAEEPSQRGSQQIYHSSDQCQEATRAHFDPAGRRPPFLLVQQSRGGAETHRTSAEPPPFSGAAHTCGRARMPSRSAATQPLETASSADDVHSTKSAVVKSMNPKQTISKSATWSPFASPLTVVTLKNPSCCSNRSCPEAPVKSLLPINVKASFTNKFVVLASMPDTSSLSPSVWLKSITQ